jgi:hypothetical protein
MGKREANFIWHKLRLSCRLPVVNILRPFLEISNFIRAEKIGKDNVAIFSKGVDLICCKRFCHCLRRLVIVMAVILARVSCYFALNAINP